MPKTTPAPVGSKKLPVEERILNALTTQRFADWYEQGDFNRYLTGDLPAPSKEALLKTRCEHVGLNPEPEEDYAEVV